MYGDLTNKTAIVTGGGGGIGREVCRVLAHFGAEVVVADIREEACLETLRILSEEGGRGYHAVLDVSSQASVEAMVALVMEKSGRIDALVNVAGILDSTPIPDMTVARWDRLLDINLRGTHLCMQACAPQMIEQRAGKIVNISSQAGQFGGYLAGVNYSASKGGILALTKAYARYLAQYNVNVNDVSPGLIATEMTAGRDDQPSAVPLRRLGTARDVANAVYFLVSNYSDYITGSTIDVNGGMLMRS